MKGKFGLELPFTGEDLKLGRVANDEADALKSSPKIAADENLICRNTYYRIVCRSFLSEKSKDYEWI